MPLIEDIVLNPAVSVRQKAERVTAALTGRPEAGLAEVVECLLTTADERVAHFAAGYLALLPDAAAEKTRVAERLRGAGPLAAAASYVVPWLPPSTIDAFVADFVRERNDRSPLFSVVFSAARYWPERLRPFRDPLQQALLQQGMLSGAPDAWVDELLARWDQDHELKTLDAIARVRTERAAHALLPLRDAIGDPQRWEALVEMAGRLPDGVTSAAWSPPFMGSVVERGRSPHEMGGAFPGEVPICPVCSAPSERVISLSAAALPLGAPQDPAFFWYTCGCNALDFTTVQQRPEGLKVFFGPAGGPSPGGRLVPGARALLLRPHPNPAGISIDASGGSGHHQVGGLPNWIRPVAHPRCPGCSTPMRFLVQIDSGLTRFGRLGFSGMLFGFWCSPCAISTTQRQG